MWKASDGRPPTDFGLVDEREMDFRKLVWDREAPPSIDYLTRPETKDGALLTVANPNPQVGLAIPDEMPAGRYIIRARIGVVGRPDPSQTFVEVGFRGESIESAIDLIACRKIQNPARHPEVIEIERGKDRPLDQGGRDPGRRTLIGQDEGKGSAVHPYEGLLACCTGDSGFLDSEILASAKTDHHDPSVL